MSGEEGRRRLRLEAHAKLNLRLRVLGREEGGYHALETLFLRLELADAVEVSDAERGVRLVVAGEAADGVPADDANLCWRAAERFAAATGAPAAAAIRLDKRIPAGSGLGGGSADAAAVLAGLNRLAGRPLGDPALLELAGELGSDVPFALLETPFALGWERGRRLLTLPPPLPRPVLLVIPPFPVHTAEAYAWLDARGDPVAEPAAALCGPGLSEWSELARAARNDFEPVVFERHPPLAAVRAALAAAGARIALLCGSGSALFGVFDDERVRDAAVPTLDAALRSAGAGAGYRLVRTRTAGARGSG